MTNVKGKCQIIVSTQGFVIFPPIKACQLPFDLTVVKFSMTQSINLKKICHSLITCKLTYVSKFCSGVLSSFLNECVIE